MTTVTHTTSKDPDYLNLYMNSILYVTTLSLCIYIYIRGGTVHGFVPNATDLSVRCMKPYDEYRIQKGALAVIQRCLITASRKNRESRCVFETQSRLPTLAMLELMCLCVLGNVIMFLTFCNNL